MKNLEQIFLPDAIFIVQASVCSSGIGLQHITAMRSYYPLVPEICTLKCGGFIGKEHVAVVTRKGKEGFLCTQLSRKGSTGTMASKKDRCSGEECSLCSGKINGRQHAHPQKWSIEVQTFLIEVAARTV